MRIFYSLKVDRWITKEYNIVEILENWVRRASMKKIFVLCFTLSMIMIPFSALAKVDVLAGGWWNASVEDLLFAREQIDAQIVALSGQIEDDALQNGYYASMPYQVSFDFIDQEMFSEYLIGDMSGRILRCGSDFEPGDYYIFSLWGANALYGIADNPNDFTYTYERMIRKIHAEKGQYIMLLDAVLVRAEEIDTNDWKKYGVYHIGKDIPAGEYKIETISDRYSSDSYSIDGIMGTYQIMKGNPENEPIECNSLFFGSTYITVNEGEYIALNNAEMILSVDSYGNEVVLPSATSTPTVKPIVQSESEMKVATAVTSDFEIDISKCTWEFQNGFYAPVINMAIRNISGHEIDSMKAQVVLYDTKKNEIWDEISKQIISSGDIPLRNEYSKSAIMSSKYGYKQYVDPIWLPDISYEIYINGKIYCEGNIEKPEITPEIRIAISAAIRIKERLKNPNSIQIREAYIEKESKNNRRVLFLIAAENGFGGTSGVYYLCDNDDCWKIDDVEAKIEKLSYMELDVSKIAIAVEE